MANTITSCRILCSVMLLFFPVFSPLFYILYCVAGFTDMIDGVIARKTGSVSEFGSTLDSVADFVFITVCLIKLLPVLTISTQLWIWVGMIAVTKIINVISGYIIQKRLVVKHTVLNRITGAILFILPLTVSAVDLKYSASIACAVASFAALQEGYLIRMGSQNSSATFCQAVG